MPDVTALEQVDAPVLDLDELRRTEMQTHDRVEVDQEPEGPQRGILIGIAAAVILIIGALILFQQAEEAPVADEEPPVVTEAPEPMVAQEDPTAAATRSSASMDLSRSPARSLPTRRWVSPSRHSLCMA